MVNMKPPYIAIGWIESFFNLVKRVKLDVVDRHIIAQYNVAPLGNASKVVSALKFLNVIDSKGKVIEDNLISLKLEGEQKKEGFKNIIVKAYENLINKIDLSQAKLEDLANYFISSYGYSSLQANGSTRLFLHLARKAGLNLSEELVNSSQPSKKGRPIGSKNETENKKNKQSEKHGVYEPHKKNFETTLHHDGNSISILVRGKELSLDLTLNTPKDIEPNLNIISQILKLNLKEKQSKKEENINNTD